MLTIFLWSLTWHKKLKFIKIRTFQDEIVNKKVAHLKVSIFPYGQDGL